ARGLPTPRVYKHFDDFYASVQPNPDAKQEMINAVRKGDTYKVIKLLQNSLEKAAISLLPEVGHIKAMLVQSGASGALVSGSGPAVFGIAGSREDARGIAGKFLSWPDVTVIVTKTRKRNREEGND
ncbi:MAG: hypothetical protein WCY82_09835, partial [Desulfotomaculaceae bacterium]